MIQSVHILITLKNSLNFWKSIYAIQVYYWMFCIENGAYKANGFYMETHKEFQYIMVCGGNFLKMYFNNIILYLAQNIVKLTWIIQLYKNILSSKIVIDTLNVSNTESCKRLCIYYALWLEMAGSVISVELYFFFFFDYCITFWCTLWYTQFIDNIQGYCKTVAYVYFY